MKEKLTRRDFTKAMALGTAAATVPVSFAGLLSAQPTRTLKVGHTGITWPNEEVDQAIKDVSSLGYWGFETFGRVLE